MNQIKHFHIKGPILLKGEVYKDSRGYFYEAYNKKYLNKLLNINLNFMQDNISFSKSGVFRGLHLQKKPFEQGKLVRVISGSIIDFALDLRPNSITFGKHISIQMDSINNEQFWIPKGFAHGFFALDDAIVNYKIDEEYAPLSEVTIDYRDNDLNIKLPTAKPHISNKDQMGISLKQYVNEYI